MRLYCSLTGNPIEEDSVYARSRVGTPLYTELGSRSRSPASLSGGSHGSAASDFDDELYRSSDSPRAIEGSFNLDDDTGSDDFGDLYDEILAIEDLDDSFDYLPHTDGASDDSENDSDSETSSESFDLDYDPLFRENCDIFGFCILDREQDPDPYPDADDVYPPAFNEDPRIRNAYITAYLLSSFHGSTHSAVERYLKSVWDTLRLTREQTGEDIVGLDDMARTLYTVERRLRIDPERYMTYYVLCPVCWKLYSSTDFAELEAPECSSEECSGVLYTIKRLSDGSYKRTPVKILPTCNIDDMIQRFALRPGKYEEWQMWRGDGDEPQEISPLEDDCAFEGWEDRRMVDMTDGWDWRTLKWGLERRIVSTADSYWGVDDVCVLGFEDEEGDHYPQRFVSLPCGLVLVLNIDWCSIHRCLT